MNDQNFNPAVQGQQETGLGTAAIIGIASLVTAAISEATAAITTHITNKKNAELQEKAHEQNLEMWNLQNVYNLPENQASRLRSAGLNPMLMQNAGLAGNTAGEIPKYVAPAYDARQSVDLPLLDVLKTHNAFKTESVQRDMIESQAELNRQKAISEGFNQANVQARTATSLFDLKKAKHLEQNFYDVARLNLENMQEDIFNKRSNVLKNNAHIDLMGQQSKLAGYQADYTRMNRELVPLKKKMLEYDILQGAYDERLRQQGINPRDPLYARIIADMLGASGAEPMSLGKRIISKFKADGEDITNVFHKWILRQQSERWKRDQRWKQIQNFKY